MSQPILPQQPPQVPPAPSQSSPAAEAAAAKPAAHQTHGSGELQPSGYWSTVQLIVALIVTSALMAYLLINPGGSHTDGEDTARNIDIVEVAGPDLIRIHTGTSLEKKLETVTLQQNTIDSPTLTVTGTVAASIRPGYKKGPDYWQFNSSEILTAYADWQKAVADVTFNETQLTRSRELAETRLDAQQKVVERLKKLVTGGSDAPKDLAAEQTTLLQYQIQGQKEVYEAESAVRLAKRGEATLSRQLQQAGLDAEMLQSATADTDIVMADVPEGVLSRVQVGQGCRVKFFGLPNEIFCGKVNKIAPVLSKERHSLRVLFVIHDPKDQLRPGMFGDIGLGTDPRQALLVPAAGIVHVGRMDYMLVSAGTTNLWRVAPIRVGEPIGANFEVLSGLSHGETVIGQGAILLKPAIARSLLAAADATPIPQEPTKPTEQPQSSPSKTAPPETVKPANKMDADVSGAEVRR